MSRDRQQPVPVQAPPPRRDRLAPVLKWVGAATAVLSLGFALQKVVQMVSDHRERDRVVAEQLATARLHEEGGRYADAWSALETAAARDPGDDSLRLARERLGMRWLRDIRAPEGGPTFSDVADQVQPVLFAGVARAGGERRADLLAHLGWADFLRWRDGALELRPEARYREALAADSGNVYAHAFLAHWLSWRGGDSAEVRRHFEAALAGGRERELVRGLQLSAARNQRDDAGDLALMRLAGALRRGGERPGVCWPREFVSAYDRQWKAYCRDAPAGPAAVPPAALGGEAAAEHAATLAWLAGLPPDDGLDVLVAGLYHACAQEMAGQAAAALAAYRRLRPAIPAQSRYAGETDAAIVRLSAARRGR